MGYIIDCTRARKAFEERVKRMTGKYPQRQGYGYREERLTGEWQTFLAGVEFGRQENE